MDALDLDPAAYGGTYKLIGGRPSLDLVNTVSWPGSDREHDWLDSPENLKRWLRALHLPAARIDRSDLDVVNELRTNLASVLRPLAHGEKPPRKAIDEMNRRIAEAVVLRTLDPVTLSWTWKPGAHAVDALAPVVLDAAELMASGNLERLRYCPACDWLFEDRTRNGQRRWCDMADCGSRDKSRRYYQRSQK